MASPASSAYEELRQNEVSPTLSSIQVSPEDGIRDSFLHQKAQNERFGLTPTEDIEEDDPFSEPHYVFGRSADSLPDECRTRIGDLLERPDSSLLAQIIHYFLMFVIVTSTICVIIETVPEYSQSPMFMPAEMCFTAIFTAEFALRLYAYDSLKTFASSGFNMIDFLAIFPGYVELMLMFLKPSSSQGAEEATISDVEKAASSMRTLRMIRIVRLVRVFRVMRIAKVARHSQLLSIIVIVFIKVSQAGLIVVLMLMCFAMVLSSSLIYLFESELCEQTGNNCVGSAAFTSIPASFWWSISTLTTVGYGDMVPRSVAGKAVAGLTAVTGLIVVATGIAIVSINFRHSYIEEKAKAESKRLSVSKLSERKLRDGQEIEELLRNFDSCSSALLTRLRTVANRQAESGKLATMLDVLATHVNGLSSDVKVLTSSVMNIS